MTGLAEKTKIYTESGYSARTTSGWMTKGSESELYAATGKTYIDAYANTWAPSSISVQIQPYIARPSAQAKEMLQKLFRFRNLSVNWDGNDALPPDDRVIIKATRLILQADEYDLPLYFIAPGPNGEIVVEFKSGYNTAEIFFSEDDPDEMLLYKGKRQTYAGNTDLKMLIQHLSNVSLSNDH